ncbi:MAG: MerR family transcriptional regulator [Gammaproteobacteria bacterium]|nr:MerR family transcriptional regulator [Gammaproteobacteria bacterium]
MTSEIHSGLFPISAVSSATGVNTVTLRAWERRYGLLKPVRTEAGHRLYTEEDIERIRLILQLLDEGIAISRVKEALRIAAERESGESPAETGPWTHYQQAMLRGVADFDEAVLENIYNEAMSLYPVDVVTRQLLMPLLEQLGQRWEKVITGIAEEHFFSVYMRNKLGARFHHRNLQNTGPRLVAACLPGEQHEFGLLLFSLAAHARGYRIILLGSDMPISQLPAVVKRTHSQGVVLSGSVEYDEAELQSELRLLLRECHVPVYVGGTSAHRYRHVIEQAGATVLGADLTIGLHNLGKQLPASPASS